MNTDVTGVDVLPAASMRTTVSVYVPSGRRRREPVKGDVQIIGPCTISPAELVIVHVAVVPSSADQSHNGLSMGDGLAGAVICGRAGGVVSSTYTRVVGALTFPAASVAMIVISNSPSSYPVRLTPPPGPQAPVHTWTK